MSRLGPAFWNAQDSRLRAGWRLALHTASMMAVLIGSQLALEGLGVPLEVSGDTPLAMFLLPGAQMLVAALLTVGLAGRFLDRRRFSGFGFRMDRAWWADFGFGARLGVLLISLVFAIEWGAGWITVVDTFHTRSTNGSFVTGLLAFLSFTCISFGEELISRGYHLKNLAEGLRSPRLGEGRAALLAWLMSSLVFGLLHAGNPNACLVSVVNIIGGRLVLGLGCVLTGQLALPIGMHLTWNLCLGNVFGFPVSGRSAPGEVVTLVSIDQGGPDLWTGGDFGPEAGLVGLVAMLVGALGIVVWVRSTGRPLAPHPSVATPRAPDSASSTAQEPLHPRP